MIPISHLRRADIMKAIERCKCTADLDAVRRELAERAAELGRVSEMADRGVFEALWTKAETFKA